LAAITAENFLPPLHSIKNLTMFIVTGINNKHQVPASNMAFPKQIIVL